jgi:hypothetical protein
MSMRITRTDPSIPFTLRRDAMSAEAREAARTAPFAEPSYRSEKRLSVWLVAEPDMRAGCRPKFTAAWRNQPLEDFIRQRGYDIAQLGITHHPGGGGILPHRDTTYAKPGLALGANLFGEADFYMWSNSLKEPPTSANAALVVTLEDGDVVEFHNKFVHAGWSRDPCRVTLNAWKIRDDWRDALRAALG